MHLGIEGQVFLIAGSTQGIGLGIAECFLREHARVAITGRDATKLNKSQDYLLKIKPENVLALQADMQSWDNIQKQVKATYQHFGSLNGIVANIGSGVESSWEDNPQIWEQSYDKNVKASMMLVQAALPYLKEKGGSITFISSIAGVEAIQAPLAYSMHKAAIIAASKKLSHELAQYRIRVNVVAPGNILFEESGWNKKMQQDEEGIQLYIKKEVPLQTFGIVEDIGHACVFLASSRAQFITGSTLVVDGGQTRSF